MAHIKARELLPGDYIYHMGHWRDVDVIHYVGEEMRVQLGPKEVMIKTFVAFQPEEVLWVHRRKEQVNVQA